MLIHEVSASVARLGLARRTILVAVSGGLDSTALVQALHLLSQRSSLKLAIGHVNHGLRGRESDADEAAVRGLAEALGLPVCTARVDLASLREGRSSRDRPTRQEAARLLRYRALDTMASSLRRLRITRVS